jgi:glycosyltransferase involved in cell wall biosynthesis
MAEEVFVSICIPAYKRTDSLKRLLDSILRQTYRLYEVIITDDSQGTEVFDLVSGHPLATAIRYFKNELRLGAAGNWNESIRRAKGEWIKIMHDDDWFSNPAALQVFADAARHSPDSAFFFSNYRDVFIEKNKSRVVRISRMRYKLLQFNPKSLLSENVIGPPSVVFHRNEPEYKYDPKLKWLVDIDFYMRFLHDAKPALIREVLVDVGLGNDQLTRDCLGNPLVEIPEYLYVLNKIGVKSLGNIFVYDAFWRFIRNLQIRSVSEIRDAGYMEHVPAVIRSMIRFQSFWPRSFLKTGFISKCLMGVHFIFQFPKITRG